MDIRLHSRSKKIVDVVMRAAAASCHCVRYDEKDTGFGKRLQRTARFCRNVTVFAGHLSKARRQMMFPRASGVAISLPTIFI
jgi:hypothetical protein